MLRKRKILTFILAFVTFIVTTFCCSYSVVNGNKFLKSFKIVSVNNISTNYRIKFDKIKAAVSYEIIIYDSNSEVFYNSKVEDNEVNINLEKIQYNELYKIVIFAYDKLGNSISVDNPYEFTYSEPTFNKDNNLVLDNNKDYTLYIDGEVDKKDYYISLCSGEYEIYKEKLVTNEYVILQKYFNNLSEVFTVKLFDGDAVINEINLYSNISPVSDVKIISPIKNTVLDYNDVKLEFDGGENATSYLLEIYKGNRLIKTSELKNNQAVISSNFFEKDNDYKFRVRALYRDYEMFSKEDSVSFKMNEKDTLLPVYINVNPNYVKKGSTIFLGNPNNDGVIYYTLDGSVPSENSNVYSDGIVADGNMVINAIVKSDKKNDSIVSTFKVNVSDSDKEYRVYLSPSNQTGNLGVGSFTNESKEMNDVTDYIEKRLKDNDVKVYRNSPNGNINLWVADSRYLNADLHLALHSNGSVFHTSKGIETWINEPSSDTYSLANIIQNDLMNIYYDKENGNRGVKYSYGALGETRMPKFGILVEVAHHDFLTDSDWIMNNKELIGYTIANSILKYFGIL